MLELEARERGHAEPQRLRAQDHPIAVDDPDRLEPLQAPADLRSGQRNLLAELLVRRAPIALEDFKQGKVEVVEIDHEHAPHCLTFRCGSIA